MLRSTTCVTVSEFCTFSLDIHGAHLDQYGEGTYGHTTVVLHTYQRPCTCERYVHRPTSISSFFTTSFCVRKGNNHDAINDTIQTQVRQWDVPEVWCVQKNHSHESSLELEGSGANRDGKRARVIYIKRSHHRFFPHMLLLEYGFAGEQEWDP